MENHRASGKDRHKCSVGVDSEGGVEAERYLGQDRMEGGQKQGHCRREGKDR